MKYYKPGQIITLDGGIKCRVKRYAGVTKRYAVWFKCDLCCVRTHMQISDTACRKYCLTTRKKGIKLPQDCYLVQIKPKHFWEK